MTNSGTTFEYLVRDFYIAQNYECIRAAGSHGVADLLAWRNSDNDVVAIQCKKTTRSNTFKDDIESLRSLPVISGWRRLLWVKKGKKVTVQDVDRAEIQVMSIADVKKVARG